MTTVALIGPDGVGKSTISRALPLELLPVPATTIYMGINLEASSMMLPTTRLVLAVKRARGRRPDLMAVNFSDRSTGGGRVQRSKLQVAKDALRLAMWMSEEWYRQAAATYYQLRGRVVVFDRHFVADYHPDAAGGAPPRGLPEQLHTFLLQRVYPKPDLVVCLDASGDVLFQRKQEAPADWLERRRRHYLALTEIVPNFVVVNVDRPVAEVTREVADIIRKFLETGNT